MEAIFIDNKKINGNKLKFLEFIYSRYNKEEGKTNPVSVDMLVNALGTTKNTVKTVKYRLVNEDKVLSVADSKPGNGGFSCYSLSEKLVGIFENKNKPVKKTRKASEVYFRASIDIETNEIRFVKIGTTDSSSEKRRIEDKGANPDITKNLAVIPGGYETEASFHKLFKEYRVSDRKEWFRYEGRLKKFIEEILMVDTTNYKKIG